MNESSMLHGVLILACYQHYVTIDHNGSTRAVLSIFINRLGGHSITRFGLRVCSAQPLQPQNERTMSSTVGQDSLKDINPRQLICPLTLSLRVSFIAECHSHNSSVVLFARKGSCSPELSVKLRKHKLKAN